MDLCTHSRYNCIYIGYDCNIFVKYATREIYSLLLRRHLIPRFGGHRLCDISRVEVQQYLLEKLKQGFAWETTNHQIARYLVRQNPLLSFLLQKTAMIIYNTVVLQIKRMIAKSVAVANLLRRQRITNQSAAVPVRDRSAGHGSKVKGSAGGTVPRSTDRCWG
jgi:hypothetical protein